jgi:hypothetical protein
MTRRSSARFLLTLSAAFLLPGAVSADLSGYRWKNRILLVVTARDQHGKVVAALRQHRAGLLDRDLVVIDLSFHDKRIPQSIRPAAAELDSLRSRYGLTGESGSVFLLVGKDGGLKTRQSGELNLSRLFALIDTMPMRREEMRSRN